MEEYEFLKTYYNFHLKIMHLIENYKLTKCMMKPTFFQIKKSKSSKDILIPFENIMYLELDDFIQIYDYYNIGKKLQKYRILIKDYSFSIEKQYYLCPEEKIQKIYFEKYQLKYMFRNINNIFINNTMEKNVSISMFTRHDHVEIIAEIDDIILNAFFKKE